MGIIDNAVTRALEIAADDSHGYDQTSRWGPDYDCSSLVISAFKKAGVPLSCTYTGNMRSDMLRHGFEDVTGSVDLATGAGLERGDVLLNHIHHTALYIGGGQLVQASINEYGSATGGQTGDQTGREIYTRGYYNYPWNTVLRYKGSSGTVPDISPVISQLDRNITVSLPELKSGDIDVSVAMLQAALKYKGYNPRWVDGEFGAQTGAALKAFQADHGLDADTICGKATWNEITKA
jgi:hypothetical protein